MSAADEANAADDTRARSLALASAAQATEGSAEMLRYTREGPNWPAPFGHEEPIEKLADATKLAIETMIAAGDDVDEERMQLLGALTRYLDGWV